MVFRDLWSLPPSPQSLLAAHPTAWASLSLLLLLWPLQPSHNLLNPCLKLLSAWNTQNGVLFLAEPYTKHFFFPQGRETARNPPSDFYSHLIGWSSSSPLTKINGITVTALPQSGSMLPPPSRVVHIPASFLNKEGNGHCAGTYSFWFGGSLIRQVGLGWGWSSKSGWW